MGCRNWIIHRIEIGSVKEYNYWGRWENDPVTRKESGYVDEHNIQYIVRDICIEDGSIVYR